MSPKINIFLMFITLMMGLHSTYPSNLSITHLGKLIPVQALQKQLLVYELHFFNHEDITQRISRIEIRDETNKLLRTYVGSRLLQNSIVYKEGKQISSKNLKLGKNSGAFVYIWIELDKNVALPQLLNNKIWSVSSNDDQSLAKVNILTDQLPVQQEKPPVLAMPLEGDNWVANGAIGEDSYHRRTVLPIEGQFYLAQRYAIDWEQICSDGKTVHGNMHDNKNWNAYGKNVLAVADGTVVKMRDAINKDNTPPELPNPPPSLLDTPGNFLILKINQNNKNYYVLYAHMQPGSIKVHVGDKVNKGQLIGLVGNTGNSSAPHLHLHVMDKNDPLKANGIPFVFETTLSQGFAGIIDRDYGIWLPKFYKKLYEANRVIPVSNQIIKFSNQADSGELCLSKG